jgi:hypothetical protein
MQSHADVVKAAYCSFTYLIVSRISAIVYYHGPCAARSRERCSRCTTKCSCACQPPVLCKGAEKCTWLSSEAAI